MEEAAKIRNLKDALNEEWEPEEDGFEFSSLELDDWRYRRQLIREADDFHYHDKLPPPSDEPAGSEIDS
jgi:hypothetical protein